MIRIMALAFPFLVSSVLLQASPKSTAPADGQEDVIRTVLQLEEESKQATIRRDAAFTERVLADNYVGIGPLGTVISKSETINARKTSQLQYDSIELSDMVVRVFGNTAVVTGRADVKGKDLGQDFSGPYRFTRVWIKRGNQWQAVSYQATVTH
jgi:hypothetical protein